MRRIDRYLLSEMFVPALVGVVILMVLLLGNWLYILLKLAYNPGSNPRDIMMILLYRFPTLLLQAVPGSLLLGTALALNRLERDREILSLRLAGFRLTRLVLPFILLGAAWSVGLFIVQEKVMNKCALQAEKLQRKVIYGSPTAAIQSDVMFKVGNNYLYAKRVDPATKMLYGIIVMRMEAQGVTWMTIPMAENQDGRWLFHRDPTNGQPPMVYVFSTDGDLKLSRYITVEGVDAPEESWLDIKENRDLTAYMTNQPSSPDAMTLQELLALKNHIRGPQLGGAYANTAFLDPKKLDYYLHCKISIPLSALVAVLLAIPFSVRFGRAGGYVGLLLAVVLSFCFVVSQQWARVLAESTPLNPIFAAWAPDAIYGVLALILLFREE